MLKYSDWITVLNELIDEELNKAMTKVIIDGVEYVPVVKDKNEHFNSLPIGTIFEQIGLDFLFVKCNKIQAMIIHNPDEYAGIWYVGNKITWNGAPIRVKVIKDA